ncbi:MAG: acyl-CoA dehydrogenase family protein [Myxococcales bacterium]|nr:acyl-CoA dehydrogenase family protein [Myxococcales bacterium]
MTAPHNIPTPEHQNLFTADPLADALWRRWLGEDRYPVLRGHLYRLGRHGALASPLSALADRHPPTLRTHDDRGERAERVEYHPAYRRLEELSYGAEIVSLKYDRSFLAEYRDVRHLVGFGGGYYFAQSESGLFCPICMTDGVGWVLERHAPEEPIARETLTHLASRDLGMLWQGAMFLTERVGGSDVGANSVEAHRDGDRWVLRGHKWFCSNVDAAAILVLARMPGGTPGTRGLGLFLLLREVPAGNGGKIRIERLKDKFGTRSMATGEVILEDAEATLIAGAGEGFKAMAEMINLSRTYNAVASLALIRRAVLEALAYGAERRAFGERLWDLPLWRATVADLVAEHLASQVGVFTMIRALDRAEGGDPRAAGLVRALTPIAKAATAKQAVWCVSEAMEAIGANAFVEWSPLPRLLRDAQVLPIWEGTTNILTLDLLRAIGRERAHEALIYRIQAALHAGAAVDGALAGVIGGRLDALGARLQAAGEAAPPVQQRLARGLLEELWRVYCASLLVEEAAEPELRAPFLAAARRILARPSVCAPAGAFAGADLVDTEEPLLRAGFNPAAAAS